MAAKIASPAEAARRGRALNAAATVERLQGELEQARTARAVQFAAWHDAGASYGTMAEAAQLSRSTVIDLVKWGRSLNTDPDASHPRGARTDTQETA
jgi:hypothetical protein